MKTKLEMAHEWAMKHGDAKTIGSRQNMIKYAWDYADAMQDEADKREKEEQDKLKQNERNHHDELVSIGLEEWQPDWSQAPEWANWWVATANQSGKITGGWFYENEPEFGLCDGPSTYHSVGCRVILTDSFGYTGDWRNSLRKQPK